MWARCSCAVRSRNGAAQVLLRASSSSPAFTAKKQKQKRKQRGPHNQQTTAAAGTIPPLTRDFIHRVLYGTKDAYFERDVIQTVGVSSSSTAPPAAANLAAAPPAKPVLPRKGAPAAAAAAAAAASASASATATTTAATATAAAATTTTVGASPPVPSLDFGGLWGKWEYLEALDELYKAKPEAWMTPVEIFAPWYSRALARYMLHEKRQREGGGGGGGGAESRALDIIEVGGGSGTNALGILDYLQQHAPEEYGRVRYTIVEISRRLAKRQRARIQPRHAGLGDRFRVVQGDMLRLGELQPPLEAAAAPGDGDGGRCGFVLAMEVLDNLPHDKVVWDAVQQRWLQTRVAGGETAATATTPTPGGAAERREIFEPLSDPLILRALAAYGTDAGAPPPARDRPSLWERARAAASGCTEPAVGRFVPTGALLLMEQLRDHLPAHRVVAADFSELPRSAWSARHTQYTLNTPIVAGRPDGGGGGGGGGGDGDGDKVVDHEAYYDMSPGQADIFFATDFEAMRGAHAAVWQGRSGGGGEAKVVPSSEFLREHGELRRTTTLSGYNPMTDDFTNTAFLLS